MLNFVRFLLSGLVLFSSGAFAEDYYWVLSSTPSAGKYPSGDLACQSAKEKHSNITSISFISTGSNYAYCSYYFDNGTKIVGPYTDITVSRYGDSCPLDTEYNAETGECVPEPDQCEAGNIIDTWAPAFKDPSGYYFPDAPPSVCVSSCQYTNIYNAGHSGCKLSGNVESGVYQCAVSYSSTGSECTPGDGGDGGSGGGDGGDGGFDPEGPEPDGDNDPNCRKYTDSEGRHLYDCSPKEEPDENNSCPPGYMMQGDTCFRIPPDHPDYDPDKDPQKPGDGDGGDSGTGDGDKNGDWAKESTLKGIDKTLKDINSTAKGIDSTIKSGDAKTHDLLKGIKDAIGNIPGGGGGGTGPGDGGGPGVGDGEGEGGEGGGVDSCEDEVCGFGERDYFGEDGVPGFSDSFSRIHDGITNSPIGQSLTAISFPSGGTCPTGSISIGLMGSSIPLTFDSHCDLWAKIAPVISAAFLALWALLAVRVFLSA